MRLAVNDYQDRRVTLTFTQAGIGFFVPIFLIFSAALIATIYFCLTMSGGGRFGHI